MFHVLLCDDEPSVTAFLKEEIPWEGLGIGQVTVAADGNEALSVIGREHIDLLITDIRMPRMDGITLLEHIRENDQDMHCILLTAYEEFEYARAAFRLGVDNYLMKPIQVDELTATVENAVENIYLHRQSKESLLRENILRRWLEGTISEDELSERGSLLNDLNIYQASYCAVCLQKKDSAVSLSACKEAVAAELTREYDCLSVWDNDGHIVMIISGHHVDRQLVMRILVQATEQMHISGKIRSSIGVTVDQSGALRESYQSALRLLRSPDSDDGQPMLADEAAAPSFRMPDIPSPDRLSPIIRRAVEYIQAEYAQGVSIKDFCVRHTITTAYLGYLFKEETGTFFSQYLNAWRTQKASELLIHSHRRVNDIAEKCGFSSTSYFISSFKKQTGMSPQKFREKYQ